MRTLHTRFDHPPLIDDLWADRLVLPEERRAIAEAVHRGPLPEAGDVERILHAAWHATPVYGGVIVRTHFAEECVRQAAGRGISQYIILGAGLDSFAMRRPAFAENMRVYEVDHPASQQLKRDRLARSGAQIPAMLRFVTADFAQEDLLTALRRSDFRFSEPAVLSWLGVTVYLPREANFATLRSIAQLARGSEVIFTYVERRALESNSIAMQRARAVAAAVGEPWICGFDSATLPAELREIGLEILEDLGGEQLHARYCAPRIDGLAVSRVGRIARASVVDPSPLRVG
jgi:methyltransferase (TIGR00027 family)